ncbi:MAG: UDP-3-O-(3-hydroxymyristoyl)glucosamine N-acyltransferase, partial [Synergistaceae bacterium]|nr:UDP-3-O-(3-hydroxymyristoyl)glucosamine N-acyltransferase [Synergistaceae bacterium]
CVIWDKKALETLNIDIPIAAPKEFFEDNRDGIICENPRALLPKLLEIFETHSAKLTGINKNAFIHETAKISDKAYIGAFSFVGENCEVGEGTIIEPNVTLLKNVKIGKNCLIHSGAVIGCDGFGFVRENGKIVKIPQNGGVKIFDDVEVGACTTIDRGAMNDTTIGEGTKIDNHVQVGHNVKIGKYCIICSMTGIAGSSIIEDYVTISVQAGVTDHVTIGKNTIIAGRTGVTNDIPENSVVSGFPARPHNQAKRALILAADLPEIVKRIRKLEKKFEDLQK